MCARDLSNDEPIAIVDGGAEITIIGRGFIKTSLYDGHGATNTLISRFSSTWKLLRMSTGLTTYLNHEGEAMAILQIQQGCVGDQAENETFLASDQLKWHGVKVIDRPIIFGDLDYQSAMGWDH